MEKRRKKTKVGEIVGMTGYKSKNYISSASIKKSLIIHEFLDRSEKVSWRKNLKFFIEMKILIQVQFYGFKLRKHPERAKKTL